MTGKKMQRGFRLALCAAAIGACMSSAMAAQVPPGTALADKQEIVRHIKDEPASLDPIKAVGLPEAQLARDLFEGLVNQDANGKVIPGVATRWQTSDNQTYIFHLRKDARWSNGDPVTAKDFVYSWQRLVEPKNLSPFAWFAQLAGIQNAEQIISGKLPADRLGVSAPDDYTLKVQLDKPVPYFVSLTANFSLFPVNKAVVEKYGNDWTKVGNLVGNGAFNGSVPYPAMAAALQRGYAAASTDTGHAGNSARFGAGHPEKVTDFGWRAVHEMTQTAKQVITRFYDAGPRFSYWNGCSAGGRQGLKAAQRFPADFDGIIAGAPGHDWTGRASQAVRIAQLIQKDEAARLTPAARPRQGRFTLARRAQSRRAVVVHFLVAVPGCRIERPECLHPGRDQADFLLAFAAAGLLGILAVLEASCRQLPGPPADGVAVLAHQHDGSGVGDGDEHD